MGRMARKMKRVKDLEKRKQIEKLVDRKERIRRKYG
jgi:hypothetical protein